MEFGSTASSLANGIDEVRDSNGSVYNKSVVFADESMGAILQPHRLP